MTKKQQREYDFYTRIGERAYEELQQVQAKLKNDPDLSLDDFDSLRKRENILRHKIRWANNNRYDAEHAKEKYDRLVEEAKELKEKYGF